MNRRQLLFIVLVNALVSATIAIAVVWVAEQRRPDPEELAARYTPPPPVVLIATPTPRSAVVQEPTPASQAQSSTTPAVSPADETPEVYVVEAGDSLLGIALRFGLTIEELMQANNLDNPDFVFVGQRLVIPRGTSGSASATSASPPQGLLLRPEGAGVLETEAIQIVNESDNAVNLQGWTLSREAGPIYTFGNAPLFPGGGIRLHSRSGDDDSLNRYWGQAEAVWSGGAVASLRDPGGDLVASVTIP